MPESIDVRLAILRSSTKQSKYTKMWLWRQVRSLGFASMPYPRFIDIINRRYVGGYSDIVLEVAGKILAQHETGRGGVQSK